MPFVKKQFCIHGHDTFAHGRYKRGHCKVCLYEEHKVVVVKLKAGNRRYFQNHEWKRRKITIDGHYFNLLDYDREYQKQSGCCKICKNHQSTLQEILVVDHDHKTGLFRGLLCRSCNIGLGHYEKFRSIVGDYLGDK